MSRESTNLLQKIPKGGDPKQGYPRKSWERLCGWLEELHEKSKTSDPISLPVEGMRSNLNNNSEFRIDCQGHFTVKGFPDIGWINIQVQENKPRSRGESTTVMTTYVHKQGYKRTIDPIITGRVICRVMESQVKHAIPEMTIFIEDTETAVGLVVNNVQRGPHGLLDYNALKGKAPPYKIWKG